MNKQMILCNYIRESVVRKINQGRINKKQTVVSSALYVRIFTTLGMHVCITGLVSDHLRYSSLLIFLKFFFFNNFYFIIIFN